MELVSPREKQITGNIVYIPFTILGNRTLVFGFYLSHTGEFTFLMQQDQPLHTIYRHIHNLPASLEYFKQRLISQINRKIIHSWIQPISDNTTLVGIPFDFDASLIDKVKRALEKEKFSTLARVKPLVKEELIRNHLMIVPDRSSEIYPELLVINSKPGDLTITSIPTYYTFRNLYQVRLRSEVKFETAFIDYTYTSIEIGEKRPFSRIHVLLINPLAPKILVTTFDDNRISLIGGTRYPYESPMDAVIRECKEESKDLLVLDKDELAKAKYFYSAEAKHIVCVLYTRIDFNVISAEYDRLPLSGRKENYGFRSIRIRDWLDLASGSFGPNVLAFARFSHQIIR